MNKVYERRLFGDDALLVQQDETPRCFAIDFPPEGLVKKLVVRQLAGPSVAFTVDVFNDLVEPINQPGGSSSSETPTEINRELAKVLPTQSSNAGGTVAVFDPNGYAFRNMRGTFSVPDRHIYIEINPTAPGGATSWEVAIACQPAIPY